MLSVLRAYSRLVKILTFLAFFALVCMFAACQGNVMLVPFGYGSVLAVAFPEDVSATELESVFSKYGVNDLINKSNLLVPLTDFVRLHYLSLSELTRRVKPDDPRNTPLTSSLTSAFTTTGTDGPWQVLYVPTASTGSDIYKAIQNSFFEIDSLWAWDAQLPSPALRFLWIIWLGWIIWLVSRKQVKDRLYHVLLITAWLPFIFHQSLPAAALMVVGQGTATILGMNVLADGLRKTITRRTAHRLLVNLAPFLISMLFLVSIDIDLMVPTSFSIVLTFLLVGYRVPILGIINRKRMHRYPPFRLICEETLKVKAGRIGVWSLAPLSMMIILMLLLPYNQDEGTAYRLFFDSDAEQGWFVPDYSGMIRAHIVYQEALAWGRLGDAGWMLDTYTRPYRFELLDDRIVRDSTVNDKSIEGFQNSTELDKGMKLILEHTQGSSPSIVSGDDIPGIRAVQLDSLGVVFYIMAMAPFCVLGLHWAGQSRRRTLTSNIDRQVA